LLHMISYIWILISFLFFLKIHNVRLLTRAIFTRMPPTTTCSKKMFCPCIQDWKLVGFKIYQHMYKSKDDIPFYPSSSDGSFLHMSNSLTLSHIDSSTSSGSSIGLVMGPKNPRTSFLISVFDPINSPPYQSLGVDAHDFECNLVRIDM
jgi:hypothetical protein